MLREISKKNSCLRSYDGTWLLNPVHHNFSIHGSNMSTPNTTQTYKLASYEKSLDGLVLEDVSLPQLGSTDVLVEVHAVSLNARDYQIATGTYPAPTSPPSAWFRCLMELARSLQSARPFHTVSVGDRVVTHLTSDWKHGEIGNEMQRRALGGGIDGVLAKHVVLDQYNLLPIRTTSTTDRPHHCRCWLDSLPLPLWPRGKDTCSPVRRCWWKARVVSASQRCNWPFRQVRGRS